MKRRNNENDKELVKYKPKNKKKIYLIITLSFFVFIIFAITIFGFLNKTNSNVYTNIYLDNKNISNFDEKHLESYLNEKNKEILTQKYISVVFENEELINLNADSIDFNVDINSTIEKVFDFGRNNNIILNNINILKALITKENINIQYSYDEQKLDEIIENIDINLPDRYLDDSYSLDEIKNSLVIKRGSSGNGIDRNKLKQDIINLYTSNTSNTYELELNQVGYKKLNANEIYDEVKSEAVDAYINENVNPIQIIQEKVGYDLDVEDLNKFLKDNDVPNKELEYKLQVIQPNIKLKDLDYNKYNEVLASYTTYYNIYDYNRSNNLKVALSYLNGQIIVPGEVFSVTDTLGNITISQGYRSASTYKAGKVVQEIGGGVCQTSSTLYNVAMLAGLEIIERHPHSLPVGYVKPSLDATLYTGVKDLKIKNNRNYPVKINTIYNPSGSIRIEIEGIKQQDEYEYEVKSVYLHTIPYKTTYKYDSTLEKGKEVVEYKGLSGYKSQAYLIKKKDGIEIERKFLSEDVYSSINRVVRVGVKETNNEVNIYN